MIWLGCIVLVSRGVIAVIGYHRSLGLAVEKISNFEALCTICMLQEGFYCTSANQGLVAHAIVHIPGECSKFFNMRLASISVRQNATFMQSRQR